MVLASVTDNAVQDFIKAVAVNSIKRLLKILLTEFNPLMPIVAIWVQL